MAHSISSTESDVFEDLRLELRRGCLILAVLGQLKTEHYGYTLLKALAGTGVAIAILAAIAIVAVQLGTDYVKYGRRFFPACSAKHALRRP